MRATTFIAALLPLLLAGQAAAQPGDESRARELFEQGVAAAEAERWADAVELFRQSSAIVERPATAYNMAVALQELGRLRDAQRALEDYFRIAPRNDPRQREAQRMRTELTGQLASLHLSVSPSDATVRIDGQEEAGSGPERTLVIESGEHSLEITAAGHEPQTSRIVAESGQSVEIAITLDPAPEPEEQPDETFQPAPLPPPVVDDGESRFGGLGIAGAVVAGVGVGAAAAALALGLRANSKYDDLVARCGPGGRSCPPGSNGDIDSGRTLATTSLVLYAIGGAAVAAAVTMIVLDLVRDDPAEHARGPRVEIVSGPAPAGLGARVSF